MSGISREINHNTHLSFTPEVISKKQDFPKEVITPDNKQKETISEIRHENLPTEESPSPQKPSLSGHISKTPPLPKSNPSQMFETRRFHTPEEPKSRHPQAETRETRESIHKEVVYKETIGESPTTSQTKVSQDKNSTSPTLSNRTKNRLRFTDENAAIINDKISSIVTKNKSGSFVVPKSPPLTAKKSNDPFAAIDAAKDAEEGSSGVHHVLVGTTHGEVLISHDKLGEGAKKMVLDIMTHQGVQASCVLAKPIESKDGISILKEATFLTHLEGNPYVINHHGVVVLSKKIKVSSSSVDGKPIKQIEYGILLEKCDKLTSYLDTASPQQKQKLVAQIARGMHLMHQKEIFHRDFKPDNVMMKDGKIRITDFDQAINLARMTDPSTAPLEIQGTPQFWSPEIAAATLKPDGENTLTKSELKEAYSKQDVYGAGLIFYQALTGNKWPPWIANIEKQPDAGLMAHVRDNTRESTSEENQDAFLNSLESHGELGKLVYRMLDPNPENRPTSEEVDRITSQYL